MEDMIESNMLYEFMINNRNGSRVFDEMPSNIDDMFKWARDSIKVLRKFMQLYQYSQDLRTVD